MPIIKSAVKRVKQAGKRREQNLSVKNEVKSATKAFLAKPSASTLSAAHGAIDTAVKKNILNKNTAARRKAHLSKIAKESKVTLGATKKAAPKTAAKKTTTKTTTTTAKKTTAAKKPAAKKTSTAKKPAAKKESK